MLFTGFRIGNIYCGYSLPRDVTVIPYSTSSSVDVVFIRDSFIEFEGFAIEVRFETGKIINIKLNFKNALKTYFPNFALVKDCAK